MDAEYWEQRIENAQSKEEFDSAMDGLMSNMVDQGLVSMGWSEDRQEIVFFMTSKQKASFDLYPG